jgi:hypothetical protein
MTIVDLLETTALIALAIIGISCSLFTLGFFLSWLYRDPLDDKD